MAACLHLSVGGSHACIGLYRGDELYGASKSGDYDPQGWCNWPETLAEYCPATRVPVKYFATPYQGTDQRRMEWSRLHLRAMHEVGRATLVPGTIAERPFTCGCGEIYSRLVEKMTGVNIALHLMQDAFENAFDRAYLVSADADLLRVVQAVLSRFPEKQVEVLFPPGAQTSELFTGLRWAYPGRSGARYLEADKLRHFPEELASRWGYELPEHWRQEPKAPRHFAAGAGR